MRSITAMILLVLLGWVSHSTADWSIGYEFRYDYDTVYSNMISREHRNGGDVDDWIERGTATVTSSPIFPDGVRLTGWSTDFAYQEDYEEFDFALASAIYYFQIPRQAQYIKIKIYYRGEGGRAEFDEMEEIAGRVWVRNYERERLRRKYEDEETLYGDTFLLRADRRSETIRIPAADHVRDGIMEMHVVVDDGMMLDVDYIVVESYRWLPEVKVVHRYYRVYDWKPWYYYTYIYFYDGPCYYLTDYGYYIRWSYPVYDRLYLSIRFTYRDYLSRYYARYPRYYCYRRWSEIYGYDPDPKVIIRIDRERSRIRRWSPEDERIRREYTVVRVRGSRERERIAQVRNKIRERITRYRIREGKPEIRASTRIRTTRPIDSRQQIRPSSRTRTHQSSTGVRVIRPRTEIKVRTESSRSSSRRSQEPSRRSSVRSKVTTRRREPPKVISRSRKEEKKEDDEDEEEKKKQSESSSRRDRIRSRIKR